jgi:hypothetical protein
MHTGEWCWSSEHRQVCKVTDIRSIWGETVCSVWLTATSEVVTVRPEQLKPLDVSPSCSPQGIAYTIAAARIVEALNTDLLIAPIESSVIPLPHQIKALSRATSEERVRREALLDREESLWRERLDSGARLNPDLTPRIIIRVERNP